MNRKPDWQREGIQLYCGDCLDILPDITTIDMVMTDPPYGTTRCNWDSVIPLEPMWAQLKRLTKRTGAIVMTASQPFTTMLIGSNMKMFKYCWVWEKSKPTGHLNVNKRPLVKHEEVVVFYAQQCQYNPQGLIELDTPKPGCRGDRGGQCYNRAAKGYIQTHTNYPLSIIKHNGATDNYHPTQKPVSLMEYLIKTYTNEGETVLDFSMGSGTTGVACIKTGRQFIGIEKERKYFDIVVKRIEEAIAIEAQDIYSTTHK